MTTPTTGSAGLPGVNFISFMIFSGTGLTMQLNLNICIVSWTLLVPAENQQQTRSTISVGFIDQIDVM